MNNDAANNRPITHWRYSNVEMTLCMFWWMFCVVFVWCASDLMQYTCKLPFIAMFVMCMLIVTEQILLSPLITSLHEHHYNFGSLIYHLDLPTQSNHMRCDIFRCKKCLIFNWTLFNWTFQCRKCEWKEGHLNKMWDESLFKFCIGILQHSICGLKLVYPKMANALIQTKLRTTTSPCEF